MTRRTLLGSLAAAPLALAQKATARPNVLFLMADDLNNALGCYGHPLVRTPNLDRLAARGVRFDRAYCQYPLCGPSRASLLSGLRPDSTRIHENDIKLRETVPDAVTLPQHCMRHGYRSARVGKMFHMNVPTGVGRADYEDEPSWQVSLSPPGTEERTPGEARNLTPKLPSGNAMHWIMAGDDRTQADTGVADETIRLLEKRGTEPLFVGAGFVRPHVPLVAPGRFFDLYPLERITLTENPANDLDDVPEIGQEPTRGRHMGMGPQEQREALRAYYASTSYMDAQVGRVLDALDRLRLWESTVVVFMSDHGWHLGEHQRWQKRSLFEESARVPLLIAAPGMKARGKATRALVESLDVYPTVADLCGLPPAAHAQGRSLRPVLERPSSRFRPFATTQLQLGRGKVQGRSIRTDRYRYTRWMQDGVRNAEEFYDHDADPREFTNLAARPDPPAELARHRTLLEAAARRP